MDPASARRFLEAERDRVSAVLAIERRYRAEGVDIDTFTELSSMDQHQADQGSETLQQEVDATIVAMEVDRLAEIEHALFRLAEGRYGMCETCRIPIPDERLEAEPAARFCVEHERQWELRELNLTTPVLPGGTGTTGEGRTFDMADLPTDDELEERVDVAADEELHLDVTGAAFDADEVELVEGDRRSDERAR
jgi:RNA polymerase-binding transcription factor DksA